MLQIVLAVLTALVVVLYAGAIVTLLVYERREPTATLSWLLTLIFVPAIGLVLYLAIGRTRAQRLAARYAHVVEQLRVVMKKYDVEKKLLAGGAAPDSRVTTLLRLGNRLVSVPASRGNHVEMLVDAAAAYAAMTAACEQARDHIHVEFYIVQPDETGTRMRDLLTRRARDGIQVRVVCDGLGSGRLPRHFWKPLIEAGGEAAYFRPVAPLLARLPLRDRIDFRNHRKLVIVDGRTGFTGGINVGREYLGLDPTMGYWRDTHIGISGPAVLSLQKAFAEDWLHATGKLLDDERYFPDPAGNDDGPYCVQVIASGPDRTYAAISYLFTQAIALATERVWITSPYFIPSPAILEGLIAAALRGVDVRLLVPLKSDNRLVMLAGTSYFSPLLEAGVRVYRYGRGFVHAKTLVVDDWVGTVGSANMDMRSFHLNYELNAFVYGKKFCDRLAQQYLIDLQNATEITIEEDAQTAFSIRLARAGARMLSPLL